MYVPRPVVCVSLSTLWEVKLNLLVPELSSTCCIPIAMSLALMHKSRSHFWAVAHVQRLWCPHHISVLEAEEELHVHKLFPAKSSLPNKKTSSAWEIG